jgi:hypothetical protein
MFELGKPDDVIGDGDKGGRPHSAKQALGAALRLLTYLLPLATANMQFLKNIPESEICSWPTISL